MSFAGANRTGLYRILEVTQGTTPTSPALTPIRYTGESIGFNIDTIVSEEIRDDRQTTDLVNVGQTSSGGVDIELSFDAYDDLIEAALFSDFSTAVAINAATITFSNASGTIVDSGNGFSNVVVDQWLKVTNATTASNNGFYKVTVAAAGSVTVLPVPGADEVDAASVVITGQMIRNDIVQKSFTVQKRFNDTTAPTYQNFRGMNVNGMNLNFEVGSILGGSFDFMGLSAEISGSIISGQTDVAAATGSVLNSVTNLNNVLIDGSASTASILSMSVEVNNNLRAQNAIGSLAAVGIGVGRFEVSGSISVYFEDLTEYNKFINSTAFSLSMRAEDAAGNAYVFTFPNVKYESMTLAVSGSDTDVVLDGSWRGLRDATTDSMFQIDRLPLDETDVAV